ncbi:MAG: DUF3783 domain-containing protein [Oscillospiraceae bacterium]|nr:DUF3783 domain-containing protein [Oscillospiraceae bacterium]MBQ6402751.1 DUF3783 domain-containing protein [Oscillospiraceae bacterium]
MNPMVLCYNLQPEKLGRLRVLALRLGIGVRVVEPDKFALPVGALAGVLETPATVEPAEPFADEMLVMAHFRPGMLDAFLNGFRQSRIPSVKLKAMLTETNAAWSAARLHREIRAEHEQMEAMRKQK